MKTYQLAKKRIELANIVRNAALSGWLNPRSHNAATLSSEAKAALVALDELHKLPPLTDAQCTYLRRKYANDVDIQCWLRR